MAKESSLAARLKQATLDRRVEHDVLGEKVFTTRLSMKESMQVGAMHPGDVALQHAETLIRKCRDEKGKPFFSKDDKHTLANEISGDLLSPLLVAIAGGSVADQVKN